MPNKRHFIMQMHSIDIINGSNFTGASFACIFINKIYQFRVYPGGFTVLDPGFTG
ncbi:MAG: hypothetical protein ABIN89_30570 [Chitinophagaceae bacterium]